MPVTRAAQPETAIGPAGVGSPASSESPHVPSSGSYVSRLAYQRAKSAGVALGPLLKKAGLTREQLDNPEVRFDVRTQVKFLELVAEALSDDLLGSHLARHCDLREVGLFYYVLASSETVSELLQRAAHYTSIVNEGVVQKYVGGASVGLTLRYSGVRRLSDRQQAEFWMTVLVTMLRRLTAMRLVPNRVRIVHSRRHGRAELCRYMGCDIEFDAAVDEITFPKSAGSLPIVNADPYLHRLLVKYCEQALAQRKRSRESFRFRVEDAMVPLLPHAKARATEIARRLGVSQRTLTRRLTAEGVSFSEVLCNLRLDLANRYLAERDLSISRIAWLLGYQNVAAFSHAFKRWTGRTPTRARALDTNRQASSVTNRLTN
jgi:AraC-like DNA-binding protein